MGRARSPHGCGWCQIRAEHNTLGSFLSQLWRAIDEATGEPIPEPLPLTVEQLIQRLSAAPDRVVLVLDDYHAIENQLIHEVVKQLVHHLPPATHIILVSRHQPDIPLARLRAYGQVRQIAQNDLAFTFEEVRQVFAGACMSDTLLRQLTQQSEGWIAGLQLTLMSINLKSEHAVEHIDRLLATMSENRLLNEYFVEEVLDALPDDVRRFVYDTVMLDALEPELCNAVLQTSNSQLVLDRLEREIIFVGRPVGIDQPLAYHRLFAECVQRIRLRAGIEPSLAELSLRASRWYRNRGRFVEATKYAVAAEAWDEASEHMSRFLHFDTPHGNAWDTLYWVSQLPETTVKQDVRMLQNYITSILAVGRIDEARSLLESFLHIPGFEPTRIQEGWHANQSAFVAYADGDSDQSLYQSYRALLRIPWEDASSRLFAWPGIYREHSYRGEHELAAIALREAEADHRRQGGASIYWYFLICPAIANATAIRGQLVAAETLNQQFIRDLPPQMAITKLAFDTRLLAIYVEQNRLDLAGDKVECIRADVAESNRIILHPAALLAIANYALATGDPEGARASLERSRILSHRIGSRELIRATDAALANYWLLTGQTELAQRWAERNPPTAQLVPTFGDIEPSVLHARLLVLQDRLDDALALLTDALARAHARSNVWAELSLLVWCSVVARAAGNDADAGAYLVRALELGAPGHVVRIYSSTGVDLRADIRQVLPQLSESARAHAGTLLEGAPEPEPANVAPIDEMPAGLTAREREVLTQLVRGKSNREIADSLFISERTVKKHLANAFHKTGAQNRFALALWAHDHPGAALEQPAAR
ncbi:MAG: LuxR C-terminal-related transcriptional regulator [Thermomicrobiales bacterium]